VNPGARFGRNGSIRTALLVAGFVSTMLVSTGGAAARTPIIRVGIVPEAYSATVASGGAWRVGVVGGRSRIEEVPPGGSWTFSARGDLLKITDQAGDLRDGGADTLYLFPAPGSQSFLLIEGKPYRGEALVFASGGGRVTVVNVLDLESYLRGVLPAEIGGGGTNGFEAVKAQAVAARSYTLAYLNRWRARGFDMLSTVEDQVYPGTAGEREATDRALRETCGVVALCDGAPIEAYYSSTCGGMTATPEDVWGRPPRSYLKAHRDSRGEGEKSFCSGSSYHRWTETWDRATLESILRRTLPAATGTQNPEQWGRLRDLRLEKVSDSHRVQELIVAFEKKSFTLKGDQVRWILRRPGGEGLRSALIFKISISRHKGQIVKVKVEGGGYGHGIGLCQMGALGMAREGIDYRKILLFYYPGVRLVRAYAQCLE
jgi:stage II sporulation protein D